MAKINVKFSRQAVILLVVVVALIVAAFFSGMWFANHQSTQRIKDVPELGIQMTVPESLKDLTYDVTYATFKNGKPAIEASFSIDRLTQLDVDCSPQSGPLGSLARVPGKYPASDPNAVFESGLLVKQFPNFYISAGYPQGACSSIPAAESLASEAKAAFEAAEATIAPLQ